MLLQSVSTTCYAASFSGKKIIKSGRLSYKIRQTTIRIITSQELLLREAMLCPASKTEDKETRYNNQNKNMS